jgi:hypothetical protein
VKFSVTTPIKSKPEIVWTLLVDGGGYSMWNPAITRVVGQIEQNAHIVIHTKARPTRPIKVKVTTLEPPREMVWCSSLPLGLFKRERTFKLTRRKDGRIQFTMTEVFSGHLMPFKRHGIPNQSQAFEDFADALRRHAENLAREPGRG